MFLGVRKTNLYVLKILGKCQNIQMNCHNVALHAYHKVDFVAMWQIVAVC